MVLSHDFFYNRLVIDLEIWMEKNPLSSPFGLYDGTLPYLNQARRSLFYVV